MIEHALRSLLANAEGVTNYVSDRIYYVQAIQEVQLPYIVMHKVSSPRVHSHDGYSNLANPRFQFSSFAETYLEAKQITRAIQQVLQGYRGVSAGVHIQMCLYMNEVDMYEEQSGLYHVAVDYEIFHREILPTPEEPYYYEKPYPYEKPYYEGEEYEKTVTPDEGEPEHPHL